MKRVVLVGLVSVLVMASVVSAAPIFVETFNGGLSQWTTSVSGGGTSTGVSVADSAVTFTVEPTNGGAIGLACITTNQAFAIGSGLDVTATVQFSKWMPGDSSLWYYRPFFGLVNADTNSYGLVVAAFNTRGNDAGPVRAFAHQGSDVLTQVDEVPVVSMVQYYTFGIHVLPTSASVVVYDGTTPVYTDTYTYEAMSNIKIQIGAGNNAYYPWTQMSCDFVQVVPEPFTLGLLTLGGLWGVWMRKR